MPTTRYVIILLAIALISPTFSVDAAESSTFRKLRVAITSISGSMAPPWAAHEAGIFRKYGMQVEVIATPSGVQGMNALIAGEVSFVQISGGTTTGAVVSGADVKIIATTVGTIVLNLVVRPKIEKAEQLRGKSIGISRYGTSLTGARLAAKHFGVEPRRDVHIVEIGAGEMRVPLPTADAVRAVLEELEERHPKATHLDPNNSSRTASFANCRRKIRSRLYIVRDSRSKDFC